MGKNKFKDETLGRLFGRTDLERCDLFIDLGFMNWGLYKGPSVGLNESAKRGKQMLSSVPSGGQKKCGINSLSGYFDKEYKSIFINDPYVDQWRAIAKSRGSPKKGNWIPSGPAKQHSTPGDYYGTFIKASEMSAFSPLTRPYKSKEKELKNFLTNPSKKGNSGFVDICINKYPPHTIDDKTDPYFAANLLYSGNWKKHKAKFLNGPFKAGSHPRPYFNENPYYTETPMPTYVRPKEKFKDRKIFYPPAGPKDMGRFPDGCFDKYPPWSANPYLTQADAQKKLMKSKASNLVFRPQPGLKTYYTVSVVNNKVDIACNERTWKTMKPITYPICNF